MSKAPLIERAREAFAAYRGLGLEIIDEMILALTIANAALTVANAEVARLRAANAALTVANAEVARLRASHDRLLAALRGLLGFNTLLLNRHDLPEDIPYMLTSHHRVKDAVAAIAAAEEQGKEL